VELKLTVREYLCEPNEFIINGIEADYEDFGSKCDEGLWEAEEYCCGDMRFTPDPPTDSVLKKYNITLEEYYKVCDELDVLSFGACGWCS